MKRALPIQLPPRLVHGDPTMCVATSIWLLTLRRTRGYNSARNSNPDRERKRMYHHFIGIGREIPLAGQARPLFQTVSGIFQAYRVKPSV